MTITPEGLTWLIYVALVVTTLAPLVLIGLWILDRKKDTLW